MRARPSRPAPAPAPAPPPAEPAAPAARHLHGQRPARHQREPLRQPKLRPFDREARAQVNLHARQAGPGPHGEPPAAGRSRRPVPEPRPPGPRRPPQPPGQRPPGAPARPAARGRRSPSGPKGHGPPRGGPRRRTGRRGRAEAGARVSLDSGSWPTDASTSPPRSTTSTASRTSATPTRRSRPTCSRATTACRRATSSSSPAPTSTAPRSRRPRRRRGPAAAMGGPVAEASASSRGVEATNDFFIRTTDPEHEAFVQRFVERMRERGDLYESTTRGLYCTACEAFYTRTTSSTAALPRARHRAGVAGGENYFFRLSAYTDQLLARYAADPRFVLPQTRYNEARSFVEGGLRGRLDHARGRQLGRAAAVGSRPGDLRLDRRAASTTLRAHVRAPRRGPDRAPVAGALAAARQGHPAASTR